MPLVPPFLMPAVINGHIVNGGNGQRAFQRFMTPWIACTLIRTRAPANDAIERMRSNRPFECAEERRSG